MHRSPLTAWSAVASDGRKARSGTLEDADKMIAVTERTGVPLLIGHHRRSRPFAYASARLSPRRVGRPDRRFGVVGDAQAQGLLQRRVRTKKATGGGPLLINVIHNIDDLRYMTLRDVTRIYAEMSNHTRGLEVEDTISISLRLQGDALATIFVSTVPGDLGLRVFGQRPGRIHSFTIRRPTVTTFSAPRVHSRCLRCNTSFILTRKRKAGSIRHKWIGSASSGPSIAPGDEPLFRVIRRKDRARRRAMLEDARRCAGNHAVGDTGRPLS